MLQDITEYTWTTKDNSPLRYWCQVYLYLIGDSGEYGNEETPRRFGRTLDAWMHCNPDGILDKSKEYIIYVIQVDLDDGDAPIPAKLEKYAVRLGKDTPWTSEDREYLDKYVAPWSERFEREYTMYHSRDGSGAGDKKYTPWAVPSFIEKIVLK